MIESFLNYLLFERNYSEKTATGYGKDLEKFEAYFKGLDDQLSWTSVDSDVIRSWMESMMDKGNNATSVNRRLSALRSFFRYALSVGMIERDPAYGVTGPRKSKPLPKFIREDDMDRMLDDRMWRDDVYNNVLARTIIQMLYETGIRSAELVGLDDEMVDLENMQLKVTGKRDKQRVVPFGIGLKVAIEDYVRRRDEEIPRITSGFFLSEKGKRVTTGYVRNMVTRQLGRVTSQKRRSPHVLRHSFATAMLNHEAGIESVKKLLGHESLSTTEVYTHTTFEQLKRVYKKAHPRADVKPFIKNQEETMEIKIQSIHFDATEQLKAFIEKKTAKLEKTYEDIVNVDVQLAVVKPATAMNKEVKMTVSVPGTAMHVEKVCDTFEEGVDQCVDSLKVQLTKFKEKQRNR